MSTSIASTNASMAILRLCRDSSDGKTFAVSPHGILSIISLLSFGVDDSTMAMIREIIDPDEVLYMDSDVAISLNALCANNNVRTSFVKEVSSRFSVKPISSNDPVKLVKMANEWIGDKTRPGSWPPKLQKAAVDMGFDPQQPIIDSLFNEGDDIGASFINVTCLSALWKNEFKDGNPFMFHRSDGSCKFVKAPESIRLSGSSGVFKYHVGERFNSLAEIVAVPYRSMNDTTMLIMKPKDGSTLDDVLEALWQPGALEHIGKGLFDVAGSVTIPAFRCDQTLKLGDVLCNTFPFLLDGSASFEKIGCDMSMRDMAQRVVMDVSKKGTVAVAVTASRMLMHRIDHTEKVNFVADRSFVFMIVDNGLNVLFAGCYEG